MLEKIGLPPKPSMRGGSWVVDASHCQGCSSQFTFLNRKHHCRRCGGIFCNSCTQQRMVLRGQGDSPVRICNPCKNLEDAARFELRHGHKNRAAKGALKQVEKVEEEILHEVLGTDAREESQAEMIADLLRSTSNASSSSLKEESNSTFGTGAISPEELRRQAVEEKKKYKILKGEGKSEEALQAFKRGKELERQAGALEIAIRKNRRMASKVLNSSSSVSSSSQKIEDSEEPGSKRKLSSLKSKEDKGDLAAELRELGWSDADLQNADKKPVKLSLEGELSNLLEEIPQRTSVSRKTGGIDKSEVISLKKKALLLKREGKLAEAKEELKKAKVLEKRIEEQELLGESDESDDELSALMRSVGDVKQDDLLLDHAPIAALNLDRFLVGDNDLDDNFEISDNDMNDPEIAAALKSFGWSEEDDEEATDHIVESSPFEGEALQQKILSLKREALSKKREGNVSEAMSLLKKAKLLEKDLEIIAPKSSSDGSISQVSVEPSHDQVSHEENVVKLPAKSKIAIQRELLALKKKALALRREGRVEEADEELKKCKSLEQQLEEAENSQKRPVASKMGNKNLEINNIDAAQLGSLDHEGVETEVTEQDMHDPAMMTVLKNLGWNDDGADSPEKVVDDTSVKPRRSKPEIQRELLAIKRKALTLRRQGKTEEADEGLERAKDLEKQLDDIETSSSSKFNVAESQNVGPSISQDKPDLHNPNGGSLPVDKDQQDILEGSNKRKPLPTTFVESTKLFPSERQQNTVDFFSNSSGIMLQSTVERVKEADETEAQKKAILSHKRKALALKKEGKLSEARDELRQAKLLESSLEGGNLQSNTLTRNTPASTSEPLSSASEIRTNQQDQKLAQTSPQKPLSSRERFKMQQQSLAHKRNALKLRREGKIEESEAELELAKALESQLEDSGSQGSSANSQVMDDTGIEDLLDPQLRSALKSIGWGDSEMSVQPPKNLELKQAVDKGGNSHQEKTKLEETIKSEKMRALNLKREGKQTEALEALRSAKRLEKKLASLT